MRKNRSTQLIAAAVLALAFSVQPAQGGISQPIRAQTQEASAPLAPGDLDPSFGEDGLVTTDMNRNSAANALVLQPDGKLVAAGKVVAGMGTGELDAKYDFALTRHNSDGGLDETFGAGGLVTTDFGDTTNIATSLALQDDGKIISVGSSFPYGPFGNQYACAVARYHEDGSLDNSFGDDGKTVILWNGSCNAVALQSDGKIIAAGGVSLESVQDKWGIGLLRLNGDGSLDNDFGVDGIVKTYSDNYQLGANSIHIVSDDKIIAAGGADNYPFQEFALVRYDNDGNLDTSFGTNGIAITAFGDQNISFDAALQPDGKIVMTGIAAYEGRNAFSVVRFTGDGELDTDFGTDGRTVTDVGGYGGYGNTVLIQPDDKIVVTGGCYLDRQYVALVRYDSDGELDESFGTDGISTAFWGGDDNSNDSVLQPDGKIVLGGYAINQINISNMILARFDSLGALDSDFGTGSLVTTRFLGSFDTAYALALQPDGKAVVAGASTGGQVAVYSVSRYNSDGSPDDTFGIDGVAYTTIQWSGGHAFGVVIQPDEKIVAVGDTYDGVMYFGFGLARFNNDGSLDNSFGGNGTVATAFDGNMGQGTSIILQPDGMIIAAGWAGSSISSMDFALARYDSSGNLDPTFGTGGKVSTDFNVSS